MDSNTISSIPHPLLLRSRGVSEDPDVEPAESIEGDSVGLSQARVALVAGETSAVALLAEVQTSAQRGLGCARDVCDEDTRIDVEHSAQIMSSGEVNAGVDADHGMPGPSKARTQEKQVVVAVPPTLAALAAKDDVDESSNLATSGGAASGSGGGPNASHFGPCASHNASGRMHDLVASPLRAQIEAARAAKLDAQREKLRKLRARAKKVRQRMFVTASSLRIDQLEQLWAGPGSTQGSKRILRLLAELTSLVSQPNCDGVETCAWELCRLLEAGRERDLHTVRTQGGLDSLVTLSMAGVADGAGVAAPFSAVSSLPTVRTSTKTAAVRAILAACALPQNRAYLLLTASVEKLAFSLLPAAVDMDSRQDMLDGRCASPATVFAPPDALLLPLLKVLRLVIATTPVVEAGRKLRADLVLVVLYSGGLNLLKDYCASCAATLEGAARHQPLLVQYFALLHALLLPLHADGGSVSTCAAPLYAYLEESRLCGVPEMVTNILFESTQPAGFQPQPTAELSASGIASGLTVNVLKVCRIAIQLLVHTGALKADVGSSSAGPGFLRRVLGAEELRINTFQLAHLTLSLFSAVEEAQPQLALAIASSSEEAAVSKELRHLLHEVLLLLGIFSLQCPHNAEALRWRWGSHPTMLHRLVDLPFRYLSDPRCRQVLLPTLLCATLHESVNLRILSERLSPEHLLSFLRAEKRAHRLSADIESKEASDDPLCPIVLADDPSELPMVSLEYKLAARLHPSTWDRAIDFLSSRPEPPDAEHSSDPPPLTADSIKPSGVLPTRMADCGVEV